MSTVNRFTHKAIRWDRLRDVRGYAALIIGTAGGAGMFPVAPGTMGTLFAVPLAWFTADAHPALRAALWLALLAAGTWAARVLEELMGTSDNQSIVMDEVVGYGITAWTVGHDARAAIVAFVLFRLFDMVKVPPARQMDRWSKKARSPWVRGFGVMGDDVVAGFQGLAVVLIAQRLGLL